MSNIQKEYNNFEWKRFPENGWSDKEVSGLHSYVCNSCKGELTGNGNDIHNRICPLCGSSNLVSREFSDKLRPDYVIPFKIDKIAAIDIVKKNMKWKRFI